MSRDARPLAARFPDARVVAADLLDPATLPPALEGIEVAYYLAHSMGGGERGLRRARPAGGPQLRAGGGRAPASARIVYLGGLGDDAADLSHHLASRHETGAELAAHGVPVTEFRAAVDHRLRQRVVRDPAPPDRAAADHDHAALGGHPLPADRHPRRARLPRRRARPSRGHRDRRDRRPGRPLLRRHDADLRPPARPAPPDDPGPGAHAAPQLVLGQPRLAGPGGDRPAAHRGPAQRGRRPRPGAGRGLRPPARCPIAEALQRAIDRTDRHDVESTWFDALAAPDKAEPLVGDVPRGDDRRAPAADRRGAAGAGLRRGRARGRRRRLAVREPPVAGARADGSHRRRRRDAPGTPRPRPPAGGRRARLLAGGGGPPARRSSACGPR